MGDIPVSSSVPPTPVGNPSGASGGTTAPVPVTQLGVNGEFPWSGSDSKECGQSCLQHKTAEEVALMTMYQLQVTSKVEGLDFSDNNKNKQQDIDVFRSIENGFCNNGESNDSCKVRFLQAQYSYLLLLRDAEVQNKVNAGRFMTQSGAGHFGKVKDAKDQPKKAQIPYVPTVSDLEVVFKKQAPVQKQDYNNWKQITHRAPTDNDFLVYESKVVDSEKKSSGKITVPVKVGDQQKISEYAQPAQVNYQKFLGQNKDEIEKFNKRDLYKVIDSKTTTLKSEAGQDRVDLFNEARAKVVDAVNSAIFGAGIKTTTTFGGKPSPSVQLKKNDQVDLTQGQSGRAPAGQPKANGNEYVFPVTPTPDNEDSFVTIGWEPNKLQRQIEDIKYY